MRAGRGDRQTDALSRGHKLGAHAGHLVPQFGDVAADARAHLDDRLVQLALDLIAERGRARRDELAHVRPESPGTRIDDLELSSTPSVNRCVICVQAPETRSVRAVARHHRELAATTW